MLGSRFKVETQHYRAVICSRGFAIFDLDGHCLADCNGLYSRPCSVHNLTADYEIPIEGAAPGEVLQLDELGSLSVNGKIMIKQDLWGGACRPQKHFETTVVQVDHDASWVRIEPPIPKKWFSHTLAIHVLSLEEPCDHISSRVKNVSKDGDITRVTWEQEFKELVMSMEVAFDRRSPRIVFRPSIRYRQDLMPYEQSIAFYSLVPLQAVFLKNRKVESSTDKNYWLWKGGARFGTGGTSWFTNHNHRINGVRLFVKTAPRRIPVPLNRLFSEAIRRHDRDSVQLLARGLLSKDRPMETKTSPAHLLFDLEHHDSQKYRRHIRGEFFTEFTESKEYPVAMYKRGDTVSYEFSIWAGNDLPPVARCMLSPHGCKATHCWTEHADGTDMRSHRAAYFGHEDIENVQDAIGGFVGHGHVVTKSVYYDNPERRESSIRSFENDELGKFGPQAAIKITPGFSEFLDQLDEAGHEICSHTHSPRPAPHELETRSLQHVSKYRSKTWIDHNIAEVCSDISKDGYLTDDITKNMISTWKKYGIEWFWAWSSEDYAYKARNNINMLHCAHGHATPTPLYWRHPTILGSSVVWGASEVNLEHFTKENIDRLVEEWGVLIHHGYYPFLGVMTDREDYLVSTGNGQLAASPRFNDVLSYMTQLREQGDLHNANSR